MDNASTHKEKKTHRCSICDSIFSEKGSLKRHIESVHEKKSHISVHFVITALMKKVT